jgi:hypothetical protein
MSQYWAENELKRRNSKSELSINLPPNNLPPRKRKKSFKKDRSGHKRDASPRNARVVQQPQTRHRNLFIQRLFATSVLRQTLSDIHFSNNNHICCNMKVLIINNETLHLKELIELFKDNDVDICNLWEMFDKDAYDLYVLSWWSHHSIFFEPNPYQKEIDFIKNTKKRLFEYVCDVK